MTRSGVRIRWWWMALWVVVVAGCNVKDAFTGNARVVARAGKHELPVEQLATILAGWREAPLRRDMAERWAHRWVEWVLFAQRLAANDSLLDSATVRWAMWPEVHRILVDAYHEKLVAERVRVDSGLVDSVYAAGEHRAIDHILIRTTSFMSPADKEEARRRAEALRARLAAGGSWERANEQSEDSVAGQRNGSVGVIRRGRMVDQFERAAFALAPGQLSEVTETAYGYHIMRRPVLPEVRERFRQAVKELLVRRMDSTFLRELMERWRVKVRSRAPALLREATREPLAAIQSKAVLGTYKGGKYTVHYFVRWLQALPSQTQQQIRVAGDEQLMEFARSLIRNEVLFLEARAAGAKLSDEDYTELKFRLKRDIIEVRAALGLDVALATTATESERQRAIEETVGEYIRGMLAAAGIIAVRGRPESYVPVFLADKFRAEMRWNVSSAGLDRVVERATALRAQLESATVGSEGEAPGRNDGQ